MPRTVDKPFAAGTMTKSAFFTMIRSALRNRSRYWKPISICKQNAKRKYKGKNKRQKFEYQCNVCKKWYSDKQISVDHIQPVGSLMEFTDLPRFVRTLFCELDNLQTICTACHNHKTASERNKPKVVEELTEESVQEKMVTVKKERKRTIKKDQHGLK